MKIVKCPNCQNNLLLDESIELITCNECGAIYKNPLYSPDFVYVPDEEIVRHKIKCNKKLLTISLIALFSIVLISTIIMGSISLAFYSPEYKFDSIVKDLSNLDDVRYYLYTHYDDKAEVFIKATLWAEYNYGNNDLRVYYFESTKDAKKYFNRYKDDLNAGEDIVRDGRYVYIGENLDEIV